MGGCRCSFRNCTVKSDGKTHMFHYPVFDKARCHQWILNCQRYEYLNLTVSQVRNRVVCQHHFKDDCFMNFKKGKLKFDAVPTENGPYCTSIEDIDINSQSVAKAYSLIVDDIDNDLSFIDKKAISSTKYEDFLTSACITVMENVPWQLDDQKETISENCYPNGQYVAPLRAFKPPSNTKSMIVNDTGDLITQQSYKTPVDKSKSIYNNKQSAYNRRKKNNLEKDFPLTKSAKTTLEQNSIQMPSVEPVVPDNLSSVLIYPIHYDQGANTNSSNNVIINNEIQNDQFAQIATTGQEMKPIKENKIKILSERTISEPLPFIGKLEPVSPSLIIRLPVKKPTFDTTQNMELNIYNNLLHKPDGIAIVDAVTCETSENKDVLLTKIETEPKVCNNNDISSHISSLPDKKSLDISQDVEFNIHKDDLHKRNNNLPNADAVTCDALKSKKSNILETKIEIEIEPNVCCSDDKRNKFKELIQKSPHLKNKITPNRVVAIEQKRNFNKKLVDIIESCLENTDSKVHSRLTPQSEKLKGSQDYTIAFLESRMKQMENVLLRKIDQNSQRIIDLKESVAPRKRFNISTQTHPNKESFKKYLYHEISKFLSPSANSLIYEELFINKYAEKLPNPESLQNRKRRKR